MCVCVYIYIQSTAFNFTHLSWQYCLCGLWEGSLTTVVGFRVALDSLNNGTLVCAAAHILCGTVHVKQVDHIRAASFVGNLVMIGNVGMHLQEK